MEQPDEATLQCPICLDDVAGGGGERSTAKLLCGHQFHLDCIGSAFNAKGVMQCPYCRQIESGYWLYPTGLPTSQALPTDDDLLFDEDPRDFAHTEVSAPTPPPESLSSFHILERSVDGSGHHDRWNPMSGPSYDQLLQTVHSLDFYHNLWTHMTHSLSPHNYYINGVAEQPVVPLGTMRIGGVDSGNQQTWPVPPLYGNGAERHRIASVPPMAPQLTRAIANIVEHFQQGSSSLSAGSQRSGGSLGAAGGPAAAVQLQDNPFYLFPPSSSGSISGEAAEGDRGHFGPNSLVNNEGGWPSSSQQLSPLDAPDPFYAARRLFGQLLAASSSSAPPESSSPNDESFHRMRLHRD
ncbi:hypothetical protein EJB05_30547, partial [Eragrostis curvula]